MLYSITATGRELRTGAELRTGIDDWIETYSITAIGVQLLTAIGAELLTGAALRTDEEAAG